MIKSLVPLALALCFFVSIEGLARSPRVGGKPASGKPGDGKPGDVGGRPAGVPKAGDSDAAAAHLPSGKVGGDGIVKRPQFAPLPQGDSKSAIASEADKATIEGGIAGLLKSQETLRNGLTVKQMVEGIVKELQEKLGLSAADTAKLEEALALIVKQEALYKEKGDDTQYLVSVKSFLEELFNGSNKVGELSKDDSKKLLAALKDQGIDPADFAANLIFAFRNNPEGLKLEIRDLSDLLKQGDDVAGPRIAARNLQVTAYANAFKSALSKNEPLVEAERQAMIAVLDLYRSKGLSEEEIRKLQCECLKTQFSCPR